MAISRRTTKGPAKAGDSAGSRPVLRPGQNVRAGTPQAQPQAQDLDADLESEEVESDDSEKTAPNRAAVGARATPSKAQPAGRSTSGVRRVVRGTPSHSQSAEESDGGQQPSRAARGSARAGRGDGGGAGIGALQRRGMSVTIKFSIFTALVTLTITGIFGAVSLSGLQSQLENEIKRSGYQQILELHAFGQHVIGRFKGVRYENEFKRKSEEYTAAKPDPKNPVPGYGEDLEQIRKILNGSKRIKDIAIFASWEEKADPSIAVLRGDPTAKNFATASKTVALDVENADPDVQAYQGEYGGEQCLYFRMPLEKGSAPGKIYSSISLILSASEIASQVRGMQMELMLFGLLLLVFGVAASYGVALMISRPINSLVDDINIVSQGDLDHESAVHNRTSDEVGLLAMAFNRMIHNLRDARDLERDIERINSELDTAKKIHFNLLPDKLPQLPGIDIANEYKSAKEVGGDYYDFIPVDNDHLALCVADVSGKGIPGSMVMGTTRNILRMMAVRNLSASDVLAKTNFYVARDIKRGMFVTCIYAILNVHTRELTVASAGHNPMLVWRAATKTIEKVRPNGIALGFDKGPIFNRTVREEKVKLLHGDRVILYTDGVVEAMDGKHREWTDEALDEFTLKNATLSSKEYVRLLLKALDEHKGNAEQHDDITVTTFRIV